MVCKHLAPFTFTVTSPFSAAFIQPGETGDTQQYSITSGSFFNVISASIGFDSDGVNRQYLNFADKLITDYSASVEPGSAPLVVQLNGETAKYFIAIDGGLALSMSFGNLPSAKLMGFPNANIWHESALVAGAGSEGLSSSFNITHFWRSEKTRLFEPTYIYEDMSTATDLIADDGSSFSFARTGHELMEDWEHRFERIYNIFQEWGRNTDYRNWTWEKHLTYLSSTKPFLFTTSSLPNLSGAQITRVHQHRADGAKFKPVRTQAGLDNYWTVKIRGRVLTRGVDVIGGILYPGSGGLGDFE